MPIYKKWKPVYQYILDSIDFSDYQIEAETDREKLAALWDEFTRTYDYEIKRQGYHAAMKEWLSGLPTCIGIAFYNGEILELAEKWKSIPKNASEGQQDKILENYWNFMATRIFDLLRANKIV